MWIQETITTIERNMTIMKTRVIKMSITYLVVKIEVKIGIMEGQKIFTRRGQHHGRGKC